MQKIVFINLSTTPPPLIPPKGGDYTELIPKKNQEKPYEITTNH
jgi:hypothetical protein